MIRFGGVVVLLLGIPVAATLPALLSLAILAAVLIILVVVETVYYAEVRDRLRHAGEDRQR